MKTLMGAAAAALILAAGSSALAQRSFGPSPDANGDGKITLAEMQTSRVTRVMQDDTNHDGKVSKAEFVTAMQARMASFGGGGPGGGQDFALTAFARLDLNGDGFVTKDEILKATAQRFAAMDTGHKGYVTVDQMRQMRGAGR